MKDKKLRNALWGLLIIVASSISSVAQVWLLLFGVSFWWALGISYFVALVLGILIGWLFRCLNKSV